MVMIHRLHLDDTAMVLFAIALLVAVVTAAGSAARGLHDAQFQGRQHALRDVTAAL
ncbi:hypothetical protein U8607_19595 [Methylobacterium durans]|uniref:hypothetical protein n=1 Tax=Methylobacterium durans TaxID=2202825 RepID=UPI002AFF8955|nr:hypothetical protein [Methylobacterium durans]MEA1834302.1 hypothetical protein [Methylobacterium durans]